MHAQSQDGCERRHEVLTAVPVRHRASEVEYRIEAFEDTLKDRLAALRGAA
jgi:hypothetical protein